MAQDRLSQRLSLATGTLDAAGIRYAVIGGLAVAEHVGRVDPEAIRTTADVDLLLNEEDMSRATAALEAAGFSYRKMAGIRMFMDGPSPRSAVHVVFANELIRQDYLAAAPSLDRVERAQSGFAVIPLDELVLMKLTSFRDKDRTHLRDMIDVGLLPGDVLKSLPPKLRERLQHLLDSPES